MTAAIRRPSSQFFQHERHRPTFATAPLLSKQHQQKRQDAFAVKQLGQHGSIDRLLPPPSSALAAENRSISSSTSTAAEQKQRQSADDSALDTDINAVLENMEDDDEAADADSEAESDTSRLLSEYESDEWEDGNDGDDEEEYGDYGYGYELRPWGGEANGDWPRKEVLDEENDTAMVFAPEPSLPRYIQTGPLQSGNARTSPNMKPRRCKLSRKHYSSKARLPYDGSSPLFPRRRDAAFEGDGDVEVSDMEMGGLYEYPGPLSSDSDLQGSDLDDYNDDSSVAGDRYDGETCPFRYQVWLKDLYHPMWLGHASSAGKKRRDDVEVPQLRRSYDDDAGTAATTAAIIGRRLIKQPRRRHAGAKAGREATTTGSIVSAGDSEFSLTLSQTTASTQAPRQAQAHASSPSPGRPWSPPMISPHTGVIERRLERLKVEEQQQQMGQNENEHDVRLQHKGKKVRYGQPTPSGSTTTAADSGIVMMASLPPQSPASELSLGGWRTQSQYGTRGIQSVVGIAPHGGFVGGYPGAIPGVVTGAERRMDIMRALEGIEELL